MKLYKHVCYCRRDILEGARVRFTQPSDLNDPFEMKPYFEEIEEWATLKPKLLSTLPNLSAPSREDVNAARQAFPTLTPEQMSAFQNLAVAQSCGDFEQSLAGMNPLVRTLLGWDAKQRKAYYDGLDDRMGVFCLSETATDVLMWAHYADNHKGFLIEFDSEHEFFHQAWQDGTDRFRRVNYLSERTNVKTAAALNRDEVFFTKSKAWEHEREWRMVLPLQSANHPPIGRIYLFDIPPTCITGLIFGCNMPKHEQQAIREFVATDGRYSHATLHQARISETTFDIEIPGLS